MNKRTVTVTEYDEYGRVAKVTTTEEVLDPHWAPYKEPYWGMPIQVTYLTEG